MTAPTRLSDRAYVFSLLLRLYFPHLLPCPARSSAGFLPAPTSCLSCFSLFPFSPRHRYKRAQAPVNRPARRLGRILSCIHRHWHTSTNKLITHVITPPRMQLRIPSSPEPKILKPHHMPCYIGMGTACRDDKRNQPSSSHDVNVSVLTPAIARSSEGISARADPMMAVLSTSS